MRLKPANVSVQKTEAILAFIRALTFLNRQEIQSAFQKFRDLDFENISEDKNYELPIALVQSMPELKVNPFRERICQVFSYSGNGTMSFEDFLDMLSVFSNKCPLEVKLEYAFRIYDFDNDRIITRDDIRSTVLCLTTANGLHNEDQLDEEQMKLLIDTILEEADIDNVEGIDFQEFSTLMRKIPDFLEYFRLRI